MSEGRTFVWSAKARGARLLLALLACTLFAAALGAGAVGAAAPSGIALDAQGGRQTVASTLRAMGARTQANGGAHVALAQSPAAVATPAISAPPDVIVGEADGSVVLTVRLSAPGTDTVSVTYALTSSTASSGVNCPADYGGGIPSTPLTFAPGETSQVVTVPIRDCSNFDPLESFKFTLSNATNATIARPTTLISIVDNSTNAATPRLFVRDAVVDQKDGFVLVPVLLGGPSGQSSASTVNVDYATSNGSAIAGTDYTAVTGTLTFLPGQNVKNVVVPIFDVGAKPTRTFTLTLSNQTLATISDRTGTVVIGAGNSAPVPTPAVSAPADVIVGEGDGYVDLAVQLSAPGSNTVSVGYQTDATSADAGLSCDFDYVNTLHNTLTFAPGETTKVVRVQLLDCQDAEGLISFTLDLDDPVNATIARASTLVGIVNRSTNATTPRLHIRDAVVDKKDGSVLVPVLLGGPAGQSSSSTVTVNYATANDTATDGVDYREVHGTLTFAPGQTVKNVVVPILDSGAKPTRTFTVTLSGETNATIVDGTAAVVIGASSATPIPTPAVSAPVDIVVGEADGYVDLPVRLSAPGQDAVSIDYATSQSSAISGTSCTSDYATTSGTLNFAPGATTKVVRVELFDCNDPGGKGLVSFRLNLTAPVNTTIARSSALVSIVNNDSPAVTPRLHVRDAVVDEKDGSVRVPVLLGGPTGQASPSTVTVSYSTSDGTATAGSDYTGITNGLLRFAPGQTVKNIIVPILDNGRKPSERFSVSLSNPVNATISDGTGTVVIGASAADPVASPSLSAPPDVVVGEGDGYVDLPVRLSAPGTNPVSVVYTTASSTATTGSSCNSDYVGVNSPGLTLNFAPGQTTKVVRIQLLDCTDPEDLISFALTLTTPVGGTITRASTLVSIVNDSNVVQTPPRIHVRDAVVDQKDGSVLVPVLLGSTKGQASASAVKVDYATGNGTATDGVDYREVHGTLTFAPGQTVKNIVVPILDVGAKPTRSFTVTLTNPVNGTIIDGIGTVVIGASASVAVSQPTISASPDLVVGEGDGYVDLVVRLSAPGSNPISVSYQTSSASASPGSGCDADFVNIPSTTLNFVPGETTKVVRLQLLDCPDQSLVSFRVVLSNALNASIARSSTLVSVVDNTSVVDPPRLVVRDAVVDEKDGSVRVPVLLGGPAGQASDSTVTVDYATSDGTASADVDYREVHGTLSFAPGQTVKNIIVPILDAGLKPSRSFTVNLSNVTNASLSDATGAVVIEASANGPVATPALSAPPDVAVGEADGYVDLPITLSAPGQGPVNVTVTSGTPSGSATAGTVCNGDYVSVPSTVVTFAPGETAKVVRVQLIDCPDVEPVENFKVTLSAAGSATIARATTMVTIANDTSAFTPNNTTLPSVSGTTQVGQTLTADPGVWTGAPTPTGYQYAWLRCNTSGNGCGTIGGATDKTYLLGGADNGHTIRVEVLATNNLGTSFPAYSQPTGIVVSLPGAPVNVFANPGDGQAKVSFSPPPDSVGALSYTVTASPGAATATGPAGPITIFGLTNGIGYTFTVTATNSAGTGPPSAPSNMVVPAKPFLIVPDPPPPVPRPVVPDPPIGLPRPPRPTH